MTQLWGSETDRKRLKEKKEKIWQRPLDEKELNAYEKR